eukprot:12069117-Prorocentrum_lima.AAC.1
MLPAIAVLPLRSLSVGPRLEWHCRRPWPPSPFCAVCSPRAAPSLVGAPRAPGPTRAGAVARLGPGRRLRWPGLV